MKNVKSLQFQISATPLPHATPHKVEHMFDCAMTFDEYDQMLRVCHEQTSMLRTLFQSIQMDEDVEQDFQVSNLAKIGEVMAGSWIREIKVRRQEFDIALKKSIP